MKAPEALALRKSFEVPVLSEFGISREQISYYQKLSITLPSSLQSASLLRQVHFLAGRHCARHALQMAGYTGNLTIDVGRYGEPRWPRNFTGSISHTDGLAAAIAAPISRCISLGIDVERVIDEPTINEVRQIVLVENDARLLAESNLSYPTIFTLIFSAKESLFKLLFPVSHQYFDFQDVEVTDIDEVNQILTLSLSSDLSGKLELHHVMVKYFIILGNILTISAIDRDRNSSINEFLPTIICSTDST